MVVVVSPRLAVPSRRTPQTRHCQVQTSGRPTSSFGVPLLAHLVRLGLYELDQVQAQAMAYEAVDRIWL